MKTHTTPLLLGLSFQVLVIVLGKYIPTRQDVFQFPIGPVAPYMYTDLVQYRRLKEQDKRDRIDIRQQVRFAAGSYRAHHRNYDCVRCHCCAENILYIQSVLTATAAQRAIHFCQCSKEKSGLDL